VCPSDSETARRFKAAGLLILGSTTTPEFGLTVTTESALFGKTRNPWNLERVAGGSSGGSAALTAAGVVPWAHATDGGGSIRVPASCCGLFGLKVSRGRNPVAMGRTEGWSGLGVSHAVTRSVRDSAALLDALHGPEAGSRYVAPPPIGTFLSALERAPRRLKIALQRRAASGVAVHADCIAAIEEAARLCASLGHVVEEAAPALNAEALHQALLTIISAHTAAKLSARQIELGRPLARDEIELITSLVLANGRKASAEDLIRADQTCMSAAQTIGEFMTDYDMILSPTLAQPPVALGTLALDSNPQQNAEAIGRFSPFTAVQNQTGQPAMSVPLYWNAEGLPVGVMFAARLGAEQDLLALAAQLEQAKPWFDRRPPI
jgi:amidase/6-aminohexanoate-cyclic-dimer hydrolase